MKLLSGAPTKLVQIFLLAGLLFSIATASSAAHDGAPTLSGQLADLPTVANATNLVTTHNCASIIPPRVLSSGLRQVEAADLLRLRDFGSSDLLESSAPGFELSPNKEHLAIQVRQADPTKNAYCQAVLLFRLSDPDAPPIVLDSGGEFVRFTFTMYGLQGFPSGMPKALTPRWSADGRWIAFLKKEAGLTRLYVVSPTEQIARQVSTAKADVTSFAWSPTGSYLIVRHSEPLENARRELRMEGEAGYRFDNRFWVPAELVPYPRDRREESEEVLEISKTGSSHLVTFDAKLAPTPHGSDVILDIDPTSPGGRRLNARVEDKNINCPYPACNDAVAAWLVPRTREVFFMKREGFAASQTGFYRWDPTGGAPRRINVIDDAISGCHATERLICGREASSRPRDLVEINWDTGSVQTLIDLNPEWAKLKLGNVTRLEWTNKYGFEVFGDLVTPPDWNGKDRLPLVVVQYSSRGFLRGGTGDEYPIHAIAASGVAVLSFDRPPSFIHRMIRLGRPISREKARSDWSDRASVHDALLKGLELVGNRYPIDRDHLAITGLSDGASTATYALIHDRHLFSLAMLSSCCEDPSLMHTSVGPAYMENLQDNQYPLPWEKNKKSWRQVSLAMNAHRICAKLIILSADREARLALATIRALEEAGRDVAMYIYPDEYHIKWQPAHRQAVYYRVLSELKDWRNSMPDACR